jgi:hypothetical protein
MEAAMGRISTSMRAALNVHSGSDRSGSRGDSHLSVKHHIHEEWAVLLRSSSRLELVSQDETHPIKASLSISVVVKGM